MAAAIKKAKGFGKESTLGQSLFFYEEALSAVVDEKPGAVLLTTIFMGLPSESFVPEIIHDVPLSYKQRVARGDAQLYCAYVCELYYKLCILLNYVEYDDNDDYASVNEAICSSLEKMHRDYSNNFGAVATYDRLVTNFFSRSNLLTAFIILPQHKPDGSFCGVCDALDFLLMSSDMLFNLCCCGSADVFLHSGYTPPRVSRDIEVRYASEALLGMYYQAIDYMLERSC